jgi:hypothetical protein
MIYSGPVFEMCKRRFEQIAYHLDIPLGRAGLSFGAWIGPRIGAKCCMPKGWQCSEPKHTRIMRKSLQITQKWGRIELTHHNQVAVAIAAYRFALSIKPRMSSTIRRAEPPTKVWLAPG